MQQARNVVTPNVSEVENEAMRHSAEVDDNIEVPAEVSAMVSDSKKVAQKGTLLPASCKLDGLLISHQLSQAPHAPKMTRRPS